MSLFPNESYSFPDLSEGAKKLRKLKEPHEPPPESETLPEAAPEEPTGASAIEELQVEHEECPEAGLEEATGASASEELPVEDEHVAASGSVQSPIPVPQVISPKPIKPIPRGRPMPPARSIAAAKPARPAERIMPVIPVVPDQLAEPIEDYPEEVDPIETIEENVLEPDYEFPAFDAEAHRATKRRRLGKLIRFIVFETVAIALLLVSAKLAVMERFSENSLSALYGTVVVVAAIAAAVIPVIFYALPPTLPTDRQ